MSPKQGDSDLPRIRIALRGQTVAYRMISATLVRADDWAGCEELTVVQVPSARSNGGRAQHMPANGVSRSDLELAIAVPPCLRARDTRVALPGCTKKLRIVLRWLYPTRKSGRTCRRTSGVPRRCGDSGTSQPVRIGKQLDTMPLSENLVTVCAGNACECGYVQADCQSTSATPDYRASTANGAYARPIRGAAWLSSLRNRDDPEVCI
jgi:hypothetical protein